MNQPQTKFPLYRSPLELAHSLWEKLVQPGDLVVDATAGNGHDSLILAKLSQGNLYSFDIQEEACKNTRALLENNKQKAVMLCQSHETFPQEVAGAILFVYNLGYLPGGDKTKTTSVETTLNSIQHAMKLLKNGGCISITCYPGHEEGKREEEALLYFTSTLEKNRWCVSYTQFPNRHLSPSLLFIQCRG